MLRILNTLLLLATSFASVVACLWIYRAWDARSMPSLEPWHTYRPAAEFRAARYPDGISFAEYRALEARLAQELEQSVFSAIDPDQRGPLNRFDMTSYSFPGRDAQRWNFSFELPATDPEGSVLLIHGASDSPYSVRALARLFSEQNLGVVAVRLPGNGTVPGGLAAVRLEDWTAVTRMGIRRAVELAGKQQPVYVAGYSIGAPLVLDYVLDTLLDDSLHRPAGVFLYSPAIAVSRFARFAAWDVLLARLPFFRQFGWVSIQPEYDPYKYNSFAKNAGDVAWRLTNQVHSKIDRLQATPDWRGIPRVIAFQSVVDATVDTSALVAAVFDELPANGSELVLFDVNREHVLQHMLIDNETPMLEDLLHGDARQYDVTIVSNRSQDTRRVAATTRRSGASVLAQVDLSLEWPHGVYSLSHVAIPFAPDDPWYGASTADAGERLTFGTIAPRGEKDVLRADLDNLMRLRHNPFFSYLAGRTKEFRRKR